MPSVKIDLAGDHLFVNINKRLEWHKVSDFIANNFEFTAPVGKLDTINGMSTSNYQDIHFNAENNEIITVDANQIIRIPYVVNGEVTFTSGEKIDVKPILFDQIMPSAIEELYTNDESFELITDSTQRSPRINALIETVFIDNNTVQITNYNAKTVTNIDIQARLNGVNKSFNLGNIDKIPAFTRMTLPVSAFGEIGVYNSSNGDGVFDLTSIMLRDDLYIHLIQTSFDSKPIRSYKRSKKSKRVGTSALILRKLVIG